MNPLAKAEGIGNSLLGQTNSGVVSNAISELADLLLEQKQAVNEAHKLVNQAKDAEDASKLVYRKIESILDKAKRHRQELRDSKYALGL
jgi:hypothetical protein